MLPEYNGNDEIHHSTCSKDLEGGGKLIRGKERATTKSSFSIVKSLLLCDKNTALGFGLTVVNYFLRIKLELSG